MRVLVTGSREWHDSAEIRRALTEIAVLHPGEDITLVSGNARGADQMAERVARDLGWAIERHIPNWRPGGIYDPTAGFKRNQAMVDTAPDVCVAFVLNSSPGTTHTIRAARAAGIRTIVCAKNL